MYVFGRYSHQVARILVSRRNCFKVSRGLDGLSFNDYCFSHCRYQDIHNQSHVMVMASGRWLGVRLDLLSSLLTGAVALAAILVSQDIGRYTNICNT